MTCGPRVAVVIPTLNAGPGLRKLLDAVENQEDVRVSRIVAVDSGSTDETLEALSERGATILTVPPHQFNHGDSRNAGIAAADTEFAVLIVQDAVPTAPTWLLAMLRPLLEDCSIAGVYARQLPRPDASRLTAHYLARWTASENQSRVVGPITRAAFDALSPAERHRLCIFDNVCSCVRVSVWREHPFRRTRIAEDLEWASEVLQSGHRLAFVSEAAVWHSHERPVWYELRRAYAAHQRLQTLFGLSTVPNLAALARAVASALPLHLRLALSERRRRTSALVRAAGLAVALPLGQYLGARSAREGREFLEVDGI